MGLKIIEYLDLSSLEPNRYHFGVVGDSLDPWALVKELDDWACAYCQGVWKRDVVRQGPVQWISFFDKADAALFRLSFT